MNIHRIIEDALEGNDGIAVPTPVEQLFCEDEQVMKLASALQFIGNNLEYSIPTPEEILAQADLLEKFASEFKNNPFANLDVSALGLENPAQTEEVAPKPKQETKANKPSLTRKQITQTRLADAEGNPLSKEQFEERRQRLIEQNEAERKVKKRSSEIRKQPGGGQLAKIEPTASGPTAPKADDLTFGQKLKNFGRSAGEMTGIFGTQGQTALNRAGRLGATAGVLGLGAYGASQLMGGDDKDKEEKKTAALYQAAQYGKASLLEKIAEDRINPAKINAGPADPYSGEIMPNPGKVSNEFVGNTRDHHALIALKAQKVRDRINKDMRQYVNNVGDGYNLQGHLNKMNK